MKLESLITDAECDILSADEETEISDVCSDSRRVSPGSIFVCLDGLHKNGLDFISEALSKGAKAILFPETAKQAAEALASDGKTGVLISKNVRRSLSFLCSNLHKRPQDSLRIIAVTGTNGKTSVSQILKSIFCKAGLNAVSLGTLDGSMTTPDPEELFEILEKRKTEGVEVICMEASSHALALDKLAPLRPEIGIITNVTPEHLDFHKDMESYSRAKAKLFSLCEIGLYNADDPTCADIAKIMQCTSLGYAVADRGADFVARNATLLGESGGVFDLFTHFDLFRIREKMPGMTGIYNSLAAASAAYVFGINKSIIKSALNAFPGVRGRLERVELPDADFSVFIDFAHTPDALDKLIKTVRSFLCRYQRLVLLFGCGGDRDKTKRPIMGSIASKGADLVIVTSDNCRSEKPEDIISDILSGVDGNAELLVIPDRKEAIFKAICDAKQSDVIILAGKGHETSELSGGLARHFDEREIIREAFEERQHKKEAK